MRKRNKVLNKFKKYKISIITACIFIILSILILVINIREMYSISSDYYSLEYDKSWSLVSKKIDYVELKNNNKAKFTINIVELEDDKDLSINDLIENITYNFKLDNKDYKLISEDSIKVTLNNYSGYKLLYENNDRQVLITITKIGSKLVIFKYDAKTMYFDLLLDSSNYIIYNFEVVKENYNLLSNINIDTSDIEFTPKNIELNGNNIYTIADSNYEVNYTIPSNFISHSFDSKSGYYVYSDNKSKIVINSMVFNKNIYAYLDVNSSSSLYENFKNIKNNEKIYSKFKENLIEYNIDNYIGYVYRVSYSYNGNDIMQVYIVLEIDKNHIVVFNIEASNIEISKELIDSIKIESINNYSSYIKNSKVLKRFNDFLYHTYYEVNIKLDNSFKEIDNNQNMYESRYFKNGDTKVSYYLTSKNTSLDRQIELIKSKNYLYNDKGLKYLDDVTLNSNVYKRYVGSYKNNKLFNETLLAYSINEGGFIVILIESPDEIDNELLEKVVNYKTEIKEI